MSAAIRLEREAPAARQAGCATTIRVFLTVLGGFMMVMLRSTTPPAGPNEWLVYLVVWRLEAWGRVRGWVDLGHPFVIEVMGNANRPQSADAVHTGDEFEET